MQQPEQRFMRTEFRVSAEGEPAKITGYGAVFDSQSEDMGYFMELREEIDPHAFDTVMATNPDVRGMFNHDPNFVLGRTTAGTMRLSVDARGLQYEIDPPDTQAARDLMTSLRRKDITGSSFTFVAKRDQWTDNPDGSVTRRILEFDSLYDVGPVTFPAYPASSSGLRSLPSTMPAEMRARFELRRKTHTKSVDGENLTSDCYIIVGDPEKTDTWHLPWKFADEAKTKSHLKDALSRFDQMEGVSDTEKKTAWDKLVKLCEEHDITVSDEDKQKHERSLASPDEDADRVRRIRIALAQE